jgi:translocation and assembly module TamB
MTSSAPRFHLEAESDIAGYRVIVGFFGTLDRFQTTLRSEPALPPEQILSLIATGDISHRATLATTPQTGLGTAANLLIGELTHRAEEFTGKIFGINRFQIDPLIVGRGSDPTARLTVGRQITRNLSILYATNLSGPQEQVIIVEYRLSDRFSLVGTRDQDGNFSFDLRIRKRF